MDQERRRTLLDRSAGFGALALGALFLYGMTFSAPVFFDDKHFLVDSDVLHLPARIFLPGVFGRGYFAMTGERTWQPLVTLFHWSAGQRPWLWRLTGALLHAVNAGLAAIAARRLGGGRRAMPMAAALFLCFPLSTETVFFSSFKGHLLVSITILSGWLCWARADDADAGSARWLNAARVIFSIGFLCKEMSCVGFVLVALHDLLLGRRGFKEAARRLAPHAAIMAAYAVWRLFVLIPSAPVSTGWGPWTPIWAMGWYLSRLVWPVQPCLLAEPPSPYCAFFIVAAGVVAWLLRRSPRGLFLLGWTVAALTPAALASASLPIPVADRHLYLASAPLSIGAALLLADSAAVALLALLVVWWGLAAERRNGSFRHLLALGRQTAACGATNPHARAFLGYTLLYSGDFADAAATYAEADRMRPNDPSILNDLGVSRMQSGDLPGAEDALRRACLISPTPYELDNYANVLVKEGRKREAVEIFDREIALAPKFVRPYREAAFVLRRVDPERSAEYDRRADILSGAR